MCAPVAGVYDALVTTFQTTSSAHLLTDFSPLDTVPQLVVIDHGLYVPERPEFRKQYCRLWKVRPLAIAVPLVRW